jgi:hypothetical protein
MADGQGASHKESSAPVAQTPEQGSKLPAETKSKEPWPRWLVFSCVTVVLVTLLALSFHLVWTALTLGNPAKNLPSLGDFAGLLFGASSIGLIIFSLLLAIAAIFEWQSLKSEIQKEIKASEAAQERIKDLEEKTEKKVTGVEKELQGRVFTVMGMVIGTLHSGPTVQNLTDEDKDYLAEAVYLSQKAYDILKNVEGSTAKYPALNNVVDFSCLLGLELERDRLLTQGRELRDVGLQYEAGSPHAVPYLLTYCKVVWTYGSNLEELREALRIVQGLQRKNLTNLQKKEAAKFAASLVDRIATFPSATT